MDYDSDRRYWMGDDDDGGSFDDGGGGWDDGGDDEEEVYDDPDAEEEPLEDDQPVDGEEELVDEELEGEGDPEQEGYEAAEGGGGDDGDGGDSGDDDVYEEFSDPEDLVELDEDVALSADDFPNADPDDFEDDDGSWTPDDYQESAQNLFGEHEFFGDTRETQLSEQGFQPFHDERMLSGLDQVAPGAAESLKLFEQNGQLHAFGFVPAMLLQLLMARYG